uniref:Uncharacterized protein n=1 Tax=Timema bartmani TaxID=61472 RepID=A0A7R9I4B4_9NEOP|nr:unnamed protein product [Timema bartmani]
MAFIRSETTIATTNWTASRAVWRLASNLSNFPIGRADKLICLKRLHAFLDRQAQSDVWFQWASPRSSIAISSAQEAAPTPRETHGDASSSVPAHRLCGWWRGEGKARPPQASQQLSAPVIQVPPHGSATMSHWFFSWSFIRALKSVRQPLDVSGLNSPASLTARTTGTQVVELNSSVFLDVPLEGNTDTGPHNHQIQPQMLPVSRIRCGMWASFALATVFVAGAKFYFDHQCPVLWDSMHLPVPSRFPFLELSESPDMGSFVKGRVGVVVLWCLHGGFQHHYCE